jgi:hypothetical protein
MLEAAAGGDRLTPSWGLTVAVPLLKVPTAKERLCLTAHAR